MPAVLALELEAHERLVVDGAWLLPSFVAELELPDTDVLWRTTQVGLLPAPRPHILRLPELRP